LGGFRLLLVGKERLLPLLALVPHCHLQWLPLSTCPEDVQVCLARKREVSELMTYNFTPIPTCAILLHKKIISLGVATNRKNSTLDSFLDKKILMFKHALICRHCWFVMALSVLPRTTPYVWGYYGLSRLRLSSHLHQALLDLVVCLFGCKPLPLRWGQAY